MLEKLGRGNCGTVYKVRRKADDQLYVIKQIDIAALAPEELQQAIVEAQVLAALDNPYIIQYCDSFIDRDMLNIVMELAEAGNLHDRIQRPPKDPLSENAVWRYLLQILLGLHHAHQKNIVHRDLKTTNIFLQVARPAHAHTHMHARCPRSIPCPPPCQQAPHHPPRRRSAGNGRPRLHQDR
jgi:NIMA (never in mitosis gene a)-related kinase